MNEYSVIILTSAGDYLLEQEDFLSQQDEGVLIKNPYIINEDEKAQRIQAERVFIPYSSVENIQYGMFKQETV